MEVVYIYMKDYLGLKEKEYNFHENYKFSFDKNLKEILIEEVGIKIPNNFFGKKIISVNAIIGENGRGKTRILDFIYRYLSGDKEWKKISKNELNTINNFLKKEDELSYMIILKGKEDFFIKCDLLDETQKQILSKTQTFYYSNIFDYSGGILFKNYLGGNFQNMSITERILKSFEKSMTDEKMKIENDIRRLLDSSDLTNEKIGIELYLKEVFNEKFDIELYLEKIKIENDKKQIKFIKDLQENYKEFYEELKKEISIPKKIILHYPNLNNINLEENLKKDLIIELNQMKEYTENKEELESEVIDKIKKIFKRVFIIKLSHTLGIKVDLKKEQELIGKNSEILSKLDNILNLQLVRIKENGIDFGVDIKYMDKLIEITEELKSRPELKKEQFKNIVSFKIKKEEVLEYSWETPMSSGEKGMLRLFSSLHEVLEKNEQLENLILLIDELDATFHPEWQRKALDLLVKYLNNYSKYIKSNLTSQLIISSHSPFLIADLPKEKIIALENDGSQKDNKRLSAFGSNILDIYKQNFFLTSTFGEFAKGKITNVIELLSKGENEYIKLSEDKKNEIKFIINSVGEPLIKNKLERMYFELEKEDPVKKIKKLMKEKGVTLEDLKKGDI